MLSTLARFIYVNFFSVFWLPSNTAPDIIELIELTSDLELEGRVLRRGDSPIVGSFQLKFRSSPAMISHPCHQATPYVAPYPRSHLSQHHVVYLHLHLIMCSVTISTNKIAYPVSTGSSMITLGALIYHNIDENTLVLEIPF